MIKALLLIFEPGVTWDRVVQAKRSLQSVLLFFLLPTVLLSVAGELFGLLYWGKKNQVLGEVASISRDLAFYYALAQIAASMGVVFIGAKLVHSIAGTIRSRNTMAQSFTLIAYTLSPLFLVRWLDALPAMNPWVTLGIGLVLSLTVLYQGLPKLLNPDPPQAFGLYLMAGLVLVIVNALARVLTELVLTQGKLTLFQ
jgi:Yip1 domain